MPRTYVFLTAGFIILVMAMITAGMLGPPSLTWGFHFARFLPPPEAAIYPALTLLAAFVILTRRGAALLDRAAMFYHQRPWAGTAALVAIFLAAAFVFRITVPLLGDSFYIIKHYAEVSRDTTALDPRNEPLAAFFYYTLMQWFGKPGYDVLLNTFFYGQLLLGCGFVVMASVLVRNIFTQPKARLLSLLFLLSMPYLQLFFGYIENYGLVLFMLMVYALVSILVLRRRVPFLLLALLALLHILVHYLTFLLLPSFGYVVLQLYREKRAKEIAAGLGTMVAALLVLLASVGWDVARLLPAVPHNHYLPLTMPLDLSEAVSVPYTLFSRYHFIDLFNLGALMALPSLVLMMAPLADKCPTLQPFDRRAAAFFTVAFLPIAAFTFVAKFDLGMARDWDVAAPYFLFLALAAVVMVFGRGTFPGTERVAALVILFTLLPSVMMFSVNGSATASIARYRSLLDHRNNAAFSWYTGHLYLAFYYHQVKDELAALALWNDYTGAFPSDPRGYKNVMNTLDNLASTTGADYAAVYERWMAARPSDFAPRQEYARLLLKIGNTHYAAGRFRDALDSYRHGADLDTLNVELASNAGSLLAQAGYPHKAIPYLLRATRLNPHFANAFQNLASAYEDAGDPVRAGEYRRTAAALGSPDARQMLGGGTLAVDMPLQSRK